MGKASERYGALSEPFTDPEAVQRTRGAETGRGYDTTGIGYQYVVDRLNAVLGVDGWTEEHRIVREQDYLTARGTAMTEVVVWLDLYLGEWNDGQFVRAAHHGCYGSHQAKLPGDAYKGAWTNALKKTAGLFGVGAAAYRGTLDDDLLPSEDKTPAAHEEVKADIGSMLRKPKPKPNSEPAKPPANERPPLDPRKALALACSAHKVNRVAALAFTFQTISSSVLTDEEVRDVTKLVKGGTLDTHYRAAGNEHDNLVQGIIALAEIQDAKAGGQEEGRGDRITARLTDALGEDWTEAKTDILKDAALKTLCADQWARRAKAAEGVANSVKAAWWDAMKREAPDANVTKDQCKAALKTFAEGIGKPLTEWGAQDWLAAKHHMELDLVDVLTGKPKGDGETPSEENADDNN